MTKPQGIERPAAKDHVVTTRVSDDVYQAAEAKAEARGSTLGRVIRAFLVLFANDETPPGWPPELPELEVRAAKRPHKKPRKR